MLPALFFVRTSRRQTQEIYALEWSATKTAPIQKKLPHQQGAAAGLLLRGMNAG
ncbi:MAG TPA: hypothetical protein VJP02_22525 [Candidatus Sulfotelmatobacter sp.]|nr:hypothetical protein [Candidatus Sulfotelmatobacter sp.]